LGEVKILFSISRLKRRWNKCPTPSANGQCGAIVQNREKGKANTCQLALPFLL